MLIIPRIMDTNIISCIFVSDKAAKLRQVAVDCKSTATKFRSIKFQSIKFRPPGPVPGRPYRLKGPACSPVIIRCYGSAVADFADIVAGED